MERNHDDDEHVVSRRNALRAIGAAALATGGLSGSVAARPDASGSNGRPEVTAASDECGSLTLSRNTTGPDETVTVVLTSESGETHEVAIERGETLTTEVSAGTWSVSSEHPAVATSPSSVSVEECAAPATLTLSIPSGTCGMVAIEREGGPESVQVALTIGTSTLQKTARIERLVLSDAELSEGGTLTAEVISGSGEGADEIEVVNSPIEVPSCE